jgi:phage baseplate assembly protein W
MREDAMADLNYPYHFSGLGRTATTDRNDHIRDLIEQVLFTGPGERVMRADFGAGLLALVFEPNSTTLAAATRVLVQSALQQNLSHLIAVRSVEVLNDEAALRVSVEYTVLLDRSTHSVSLTAPGGTP